MKRVILPIPPNADMFKNNPMGFNRAVTEWMQRTKNTLEDASKQNNSPIDQNFIVTTGYTLTTAISGTSTGTQVANFLCSLMDSLTRKGLVSPALGTSS